MRKTDIEQLLKNKGFSLNVYSLEILWEFTIIEDKEIKEKLCKIFGWIFKNQKQLYCNVERTLQTVFSIMIAIL